METAYDWITVLIFAGLVTRFLQVSAAPRETNDSIWHYLVPSLGCAGCNWLGNNGWHLAAIAAIAASVAYILIFLLHVGRRAG